MPMGQMTIFYCGKVNVYDDVPADKVLKLLLLYLEVIITLMSLDLMQFHPRIPILVFYNALSCFSGAGTNAHCCKSSEVSRRTSC